MGPRPGQQRSRDRKLAQFFGAGLGRIAIENRQVGRRARFDPAADAPVDRFGHGDTLLGMPGRTIAPRPMNRRGDRHPGVEWCDRSIRTESDADPGIIQGLRAAGHNVQVVPAGGGFGRGQIIWRLPSGAYAAGSDKRADGYAAGI